MFILDTNHLRELTNGTTLGENLRRRIIESETELVTTSIISVDESLRGWMACIAKASSPQRETEAYARLNEMIDILSDLIRLPYDSEAAGRFSALRKAGVKIGSKDLKVACIALEHDAVVLTRNSKDFIKVPGLKIENWLD